MESRLPTDSERANYRYKLKRWGISVGGSHLYRTSDRVLFDRLREVARIFCCRILVLGMIMDHAPVARPIRAKRYKERISWRKGGFAELK